MNDVNNHVWCRYGSVCIHCGIDHDGNDEHGWFVDRPCSVTDLHVRMVNERRVYGTHSTRLRQYRRMLRKLLKYCPGATSKEFRAVRNG